MGCASACFDGYEYWMIFIGVIRREIGISRCASASRCRTGVINKIKYIASVFSVYDLINGGFFEIKTVKLKYGSYSKVPCYLRVDCLLTCSFFSLRSS